MIVGNGKDVFRLIEDILLAFPDLPFYSDVEMERVGYKWRALNESSVSSVE